MHLDSLISKKPCLVAGPKECLIASCFASQHLRQEPSVLDLVVSFLQILVSWRNPFCEIRFALKLSIITASSQVYLILAAFCQEDSCQDIGHETVAWVVACAGSEHGNQCYKETCSPQGARWPNLPSGCSCHNWLSPLQVDEIAKPLASTKEEIFVVSFVSLMIGNWEVADSFWSFFFWKTPFWQRKVLMAEVEETFLIWRPWLLTVPANDQRGQRPRSHVKSWEVLNMTNPQQRTFVAMCIEINSPKKTNHVKNHWSPDQLFCFMQVFGRAKRYRSHAWESSRLGNVNDGANDHCHIAALFPYFSRLWMKGALFIDPNPNPKKTLFSWCFPSGIEMQTVFFWETWCSL